MNDTPRPGPFDPYTYADELRFDIQELFGFLESENVKPLRHDLNSMSDDDLEIEYLRVTSYFRAYILQASTVKVEQQFTSGDLSEHLRLAGQYFSPYSGRYIGDRSG